MGNGIIEKVYEFAWEGNMRTNSEIRRMARANLTGNFRIPMGAFLFARIVESLLMFPFSRTLPVYPTPMQLTVYYLAMFLILILVNVFVVGELVIHFSMIRKQPVTVGMLFYGFKNRPDRFIMGALISFVVTDIWNIPGIVLLKYTYRYGTMPYVLAVVAAFVIGLAITIVTSLYFALFIYLLVDYPNATLKECFCYAPKMIKGYKGQLFRMACSFVGMLCLCVLSFGIGFLWVEPYMQQTFALYYLEVKGELSFDARV